MKNIIIYITILLTAVNLNAQFVRMVVDYKCIGQVGINTTLQEAVELRENNRFDSIKAKQEHLAEYKTSMLALKILHKEAMQNIQGFGVESGYYRTIATTIGEIGVNASNAMKEAMNTDNMVGKLQSCFEIASISNDAYDLAKEFVDLVTNGKVSFHWTNGSKGDGANLLNRDDRLKTALTICNRLQKINYSLIKIKYILRYSNMGDLVRKIDYRTFVTAYNGKIFADAIINDWKRR